MSQRRIAGTMLPASPPRRLLSSVAATALAAAMAGHAMALPNNPTIVDSSESGGEGGADFFYFDSDLEVYQSEQAVFIDWESFDIANGESVTFFQDNPFWIVLNRVPGGSMTIDGLLQTLYGDRGGVGQFALGDDAAGGIWLLAPDGIMFGPNAQVSANGFLATTSELAHADFTDGDLSLDFSSNPDGSIDVMAGAQIVSAGNLLALISPVINTAGDIYQAGANPSAGDVLIAAADAFRLQLINSQTGEIDLYSFEIQGGEGLEEMVNQTGGVIEGGRVMVLAGSSADEIGGAVVNMDGVVEATGISSNGYDLFICAECQPGFDASGALSFETSNASGLGSVDLADASVGAEGRARVVGPELAIGDLNGLGLVEAYAVTGDLYVTGTVHSAGYIDLSAAGNIGVDGGTLAAISSVSLNADADVMLDSASVSAGEVYLSAGSNLMIDGETVVNAGEYLYGYAGSDFLIQQGVLSAGDVFDLTASNSFLINAGMLQTGGDAYISQLGSEFLLAGGASILAGGAIYASVSGFGQIDGAMTSGGRLSIQATNEANNSWLQFGPEAVIRADSDGDAPLAVEQACFYDSSSQCLYVMANKDIIMSPTTLLAAGPEGGPLTGGVWVGAGALTSIGSFAGGDLVAGRAEGGDVTLYANADPATGEIGGDVTLDGAVMGQAVAAYASGLTGVLTVNAPILGRDRIYLYSQDGGMTVNATTEANGEGGDIAIDSVGDIEINDAMTSADTVTANTGGDFTLNAPLMAGGGVTIFSDGALELNDGVTSGRLANLNSGGAMTINAALDARSVFGFAGGDLEINAAVDSVEEIDLTTDSSMIVNAALSVAGTASLVAGDSLSGSGSVFGGGGVSAFGASGLMLDGGVTSGGGVDLSTDGAMTVGAIDAAGAVNLGSGGSMAVNGPVSGSSVNAASGGSMALGGPVTAVEGGVELGAGGAMSVDGDVDATGLISLFSAGPMSVTGSVSGGSEVSAESGGDMDIDGDVDAADHISLFATGAMALNGSIAGGGEMDIESGGAMTVDGAIDAADTVSIFAGGPLALGGSVSSGGSIGLQSGGDLTASDLGAEGAVAMGSGGDLTLDGAVNAADIFAVSDGALFVNGPLASGGSILLGSEAGMNVNGPLSAGTDAVLVSSGMMTMNSTLMAPAATLFSETGIALLGTIGAANAPVGVLNINSYGPVVVGSQAFLDAWNNREAEDFDPYAMDPDFGGVEPGQVFIHAGTMLVGLFGENSAFVQQNTGDGGYDGLRIYGGGLSFITGFEGEGEGEGGGEGENGNGSDVFGLPSRIDVFGLMVGEVPAEGDDFNDLVAELSLQEYGGALPFGETYYVNGCVLGDTTNCVVAPVNPIDQVPGEIVEFEAIVEASLTAPPPVPTILIQEQPETEEEEEDPLAGFASAFTDERRWYEGAPQ